MAAPRCVLLALLPQVIAAIPSAWYGRSVYFVMTDRFARDGGGEVARCSGSGWCGGTLNGLRSRLDYIQGMGFDAIWITPVVKQTDWGDAATNGTGYHGYWAADFTKVDPHLGTEDDLLQLSHECKRKGMLLMVDVVANHVGPLDSIDQVSQLAPPFNSRHGERFHQVGRLSEESFGDYLAHPLNAFSTGCAPGEYTCQGYNETVLQKGWFYDLGDIRQEDADTRDFMLSWINELVGKYELDGLRLDTALYMPQWFLREFQRSAGVYIVGEVTTGNFSYHRSFQGPLQGVLNFPVTMHLGGIFNQTGSLLELQRLLVAQREAEYEDEHLLGNFVDNHDGPRFLPTHQGDTILLENALVWTMLHHGIPIIYYGTEQAEVALHEDNRAAMWPYFVQTDTYVLLRRLNSVRREFGFSAGGDSVSSTARVVLATQDTLAFVRGDLLVLVTNVGSGSDRTPQVCVPLGLLPSGWASTCASQTGDASVRQVLGQGAPRCQETQLCVELSGGRPVVLAPLEVVRFI